MPKYRYQVIDEEGEREQGVLVSNNEQAAIRSLKQENYYIKELKQEANKKRLTNLANWFQRITWSQLALFTRQFSFLLSAGLPLLTVLEILAGQVENKKLEWAVQEISQEIKAGRDLSTAVRSQSQLFPELMISLISVGEREGVLTEVLAQLTDYFEAKASWKQRLRSIVVYPVFLLVTTVVVVIFLITFVLPTFARIFADYDFQLPLITRILLGGAQFVQARGQIIAGGLLAGGVALGLWATTSTARRRLEWLSLKLPLIGNLVLKIKLLQLSRTIGTMLQAGVNLLPALKNAEAVVGNVVLERKLKEINYQIEQGQQLGGLLAEKDLFPNLMVQMVKVGEKTGRLGEMLLKTADYYQQKLEAETEFLFSLLEPIIVLVLAGVVVFILISVLLPIFNLINLI